MEDFAVGQHSPSGRSRIGIGDIREFERELSLAPRNSPAKAGVLWAIERLTPEAQNALLKTLEEPPPHTYLLAETAYPETLLPTILSRFSLVHLGIVESKIPDKTINSDFINQLVTSSPGKRIQLVDPFVQTHDNAHMFVIALLTAAHIELLSHPSPVLTTLVRNLFIAQNQLSVNVNPRLVIDNAVLHFP